MRSSNLIEGKPEKITKKNSQSSKIKKKTKKIEIKKNKNQRWYQIKWNKTMRDEIKNKINQKNKIKTLKNSN